MATNLILAHSGDNFPSHINDCIFLADKCGFNIHLILEVKFFPLIKNKNINLVDLSSIVDSRYTSYKLDNYNSDYRCGFFPRTSSRFILIDNYINKTGIESFFHIENDIAMFSNLEVVREYLDKSQYHSAIVMDHPLRCVPSIIWYKNLISTRSMADFIFINNKLDDMKNLAIYFHKNRNIVTNLPIVPFDMLDQSYNLNFGNMHHNFSSIFDGAAIGQYLYGIDNTEDLSLNTKGFINETCVFNPSLYNIHLLNNTPKFEYNNINISINNLHIHSKNFSGLL